MSITVKSFLWCFGIATFFAAATDVWGPWYACALFSWWISATLLTSIEEDKEKHKQELQAQNARHKQELETEKIRTRLEATSRSEVERRTHERTTDGINEENAHTNYDNEVEAIFSCPKCWYKNRTYEKKTFTTRCKQCGHKFIVSTETDIPNIQTIPDTEEDV